MCSSVPRWRALLHRNFSRPVEQTWYVEEAKCFVKEAEMTIAAAVAVGREAFKQESMERKNKGDRHV